MKQALHWLDTLRFGGAESTALNYARLMSEWGVGSVLCGRTESADFERFASKYTTLRNRFSLREFRRADCVFIHSNRGLLRLLLWRPFYRARGKQIVYIQHLPYSEGKFRLISSLINRLCTGFIRITPLTERLVETRIRIPSAFVPNFYLPRYPTAQHPAVRSALRAEYGVTADQKLVLFTGALKPGKGLDDFLALAGRFANDGCHRFVVVGDGEESVKIRAYPCKNLLWVGWQADVERWLIASDVYCFCSRREMMPMALIEAQTVGLPVAALSSEVNDFLLNGQTFSDMPAVEKALRSGVVPSVAPKHKAGQCADALKHGLGVDRPLKILHIQVLPKLTGVQRVSLEIFRSLPDGECDKTILFGGPENRHTAHCFSRFREAGARLIASPHLRRELGIHDGRAFLEIYRLCRRERFDVVHTHSSKPGVVGRVAARLAGVPLVVHTVHGVAFHRYVGLPKRLFYRAVECFASLFSHRITLVSAHYRRYFRLFRGKTTVVYNGLPLPENVPESMQATEEPVRILFAGRLEEAKDPLTLLQAFARLVCRKGYENARLTLLGDGSLESDCRAFVDRNGLSDRVTLAGWQANIAAFYADHQIFCLSSIHEAFGLCLLEAGVHGLPVVATRVGGVPEVVEDGVTGLLVPPRDPEALAQAILRLADDPLLRRHMGEAARRRVCERFSVERMSAAYKRIYNNEL